jgi:2-dehydropantoate 2-reductase
LRPWQPVFAAAGLPLALHADLRPIQWAKLLLNLNNPVNALSGRPLRAQLLDRDYRRVLAALQDEALAALAAADIVPARLTPLPPRWLPTVLRLPNLLFERVAARLLRIDEKARSSMADDVAAGRRTEVDAFCGEVQRLARAHGGDAPLNARIALLVETDPRPRSGRALRAELGL